MAPIRACAFQTAKEALGDRMVHTLALTTHATTPARGGQQVLGVMTGIWTPTVGRVQASRGGIPAPPRHPECRLPQGGVDGGTHGPTHDLPRRHIEPHGNGYPPSAVQTDVRSPTQT